MGHILAEFRGGNLKRTPEKPKELRGKIEDALDGWGYEFRHKKKMVDLILARIKEAGCAQLAEDQELPEIPAFQYDSEEDQKLLRRGAINYSKLLGNWRKVKVEVKDGS